MVVILLLVWQILVFTGDSYFYGLFGVCNSIENFNVTLTFWTFFVMVMLLVVLYDRAKNWFVFISIFIPPGGIWVIIALMILAFGLTFCAFSNFGLDF